MEIVNKDYLLKHSLDILDAGSLTAEQKTCFLNNNPHPDIIVQSSSGTTGEAFLIPRSLQDIMDIAKRVWSPYVDRYKYLPKRIAMLGGISHTQAAMKLSVASTQIRSFEMEDMDGLINYQPDIISCYPSVMREILGLISDELTQLRAIKLGGESIFSNDIKTIFNAFPEVLLIEQLGSTEMPAIAIRVFRYPDNKAVYQLQHQRFSFLNLKGEGWQALIVKDNFENQFFPIPGFYDMGDEVFIEKGQIIDIRRKDDLVFPYRQAINELLSKGCTAIQIIRDKKHLLYDGKITLAETFSINNESYKCIKNKPERIKPSNKLKLVC